jgi:hypothetical protein
VIEPRILFHQAFGAVYQKHDLLNREETNAEWKRSVGQGNCGMRQVVQRVLEKGRIFEAAQEQDVGGNTNRQQMVPCQAEAAAGPEQTLCQYAVDY